MFDSRKTRRLSLAGLGGAALVSGTANAGIIWSGDLNQVISATGSGGTTGLDSLLIDIDGDGSNEFDFNGGAAGNGSATSVRLTGIEAGSGSAQSGSFTQLFASNGVIDAGSTFATTPPADLLAAFDSKNDVGSWAPATTRGFTGVAFDTGGNVHYGWLDISVTDLSAAGPGGIASFSATLHGFAWEDTAGSAILAGDTGPQGSVPEPGVLGLLALGIAGMVALRSKKAAQWRAGKGRTAA